MAGRGRPTYLKRQREAARQRRKMDKLEKRAMRKVEKDETETSAAPPDLDGDPDLDGIVPGPQRQPWMEDGDYEGPPELIEEEEEAEQA